MRLKKFNELFENNENKMYNNLDELLDAYDINEIHSDKDMKRGNNLENTFLGINFKGDFRKQKLIIKKIVRLKSKIDDENLKKEIDDILDLIS